MNMLKLTAAAAIAALSFSASAMTAINDQDLSAVSGQDGVSIAADLNINIGSFTYIDHDGDGTTATGGSVSFNNIKITGLFDMTIDVLSGSQFSVAAANAIAATGQANSTTANDPNWGGVGSGTVSATNPLGLGAKTAGVLAGVANALGYDLTKTPDVVQFAFPAATGAAADAHLVSPTIDVGSITTGNGGKSFGEIKITNLDLQGTRVWMFGH